VFVEESSREHVVTARAFGASPTTLMWRHVLKNSLVAISTRIIFSIPLVVISGSLLIESYFGIPGIGKASFDAITSGDQPILKAVVGLTAVMFVLIQIAADFIYRLVDPRIS
jgi:peptide/nickel transport system permease protein